MDLDTFLSSLSPSPQSYYLQECRINDFTSFLLNYNQISSPSFNNMISLNTEILQDFIIFILQNFLTHVHTAYLQLQNYTNTFPVYILTKLSYLRLYSCAILLQPLTTWSMLHHLSYTVYIACLSGFCQPLL